MCCKIVENGQYSWSVIQNWTCSLSTEGKIMAISVLLIVQRRLRVHTGDVHNLSNHMEHPHYFSTITLFFQQRQKTLTDWAGQSDAADQWWFCTHSFWCGRNNTKVGTIWSLRNRLRTHGSRDVVVVVVDTLHCCHKKRGVHSCLTTLMWRSL